LGSARIWKQALSAPDRQPKQTGWSLENQHRK
jgi:hypothetical protein